MKENVVYVFLMLQSDPLNQSFRWSVCVWQHSISKVYGSVRRLVFCLNAVGHKPSSPTWKLNARHVGCGADLLTSTLHSATVREHNVLHLFWTRQTENHHICQI